MNRATGETFRVRTGAGALDLDGLPDRLVNQPAGTDRRPGRRLGTAAAHVEAPGGGSVLLIAGDLIWFSDAMAKELRPVLARRAGIDEAAVSLVASHTHGTPQPDPRFRYGEGGTAFRARVKESIIAAAEAALAAPPVETELLHARCAVVPRVAVNRRRLAWAPVNGLAAARVQNLPNSRRRGGESLTTLVFRDVDGRDRLVINHFACHPVADPVGLSGADYPGALAERLAASTNAAPCLFLQGFCGDVRPWLRHRPSGMKDRLVSLAIGPRFRPSQIGDADWMAEALARAAAANLAAAIRSSNTTVAAARDSLPLIGASGNPTDRALDVTAWRIGGLVLVFASGEMLSGLTHPSDTVLSVGYANGMVGYVAPEADVAGGGYEIDGFLDRFALAERLAADTGPRYAALRDELIRKIVAPLKSPLRVAS